MPIPAIILAAGASRRLGQPKQLVRLGGETLLGRTIRVVKEAGADPVLVVLGAERDEIAAETDLTGVAVVFNSDWKQGIASSIGAGIVALQREVPGASAAMLLVCDQPMLTAEHLRKLIAATDRESGPKIVASSYAGIAGIPAIFPESEFPQLLMLHGDAGARSVLLDGSCPMVALEFSGGELDVDTEADLERSRKAWMRREKSISEG